MITVSGTGGSGMRSAAQRYRSAVRAAPIEEPKVVAPVVARLLNDSFDRRQSPNGAPWAPRVPPTGSWPLLEKSGQMRASRVVEPVIGGVFYSYDGPAEYHQRGTPKMRARPLLPVAMPPTWQGPIAAVRAEWWRSRLLGAP